MHTLVHAHRKQISQLREEQVEAIESLLVATGCKQTGLYYFRVVLDAVVDWMCLISQGKEVWMEGAVSKYFVLIFQQISTVFTWYFTF